MGDNCEYRLKGPYVVLSFLLLLFCVLCGVIVNSVLKSRFSIISVSGFRKRKKQRTNMARCSSRENYYSSGRNTELMMPLIPISCSSVSCCRRCLRCAKRCSFCSVVSCRRLLHRSRWIWSRRSRPRGVSVENLPWARIWSHFLCLWVICMGNCPWFTDGKLCFTGDE